MKTLKFQCARSKSGAMTAEYVATLYLLLLFLLFPLLNLAAIGLRSFFLWFACNQATMAGAKARTLSTDITIGGTTYKSAFNLVRDRSNQIRAAFPGIDWVDSSTNPKVEILRTAIPNSTPPITYYSPFVCTGPGVALSGQVPDVDRYVVTLRVTINGTVSPLLPMTLPGPLAIEGLTAPFDMTVTSEAAFENPPGVAL
ncbi:MAG: hypothetical protein IPM23_09325 [Candidatus Melainabacteria bacterium]|nr:hypothetical protein [Candidatus Melainabacteria bacterium]